MRRCPVPFRRAFIASTALLATSIGLGGCSDGKTAFDGYALLLVSTGGGAIVSEPAGIDCRTDCLFSSVVFPKTERVLLIATPDVGGYFVGWGGDCAGVTGTTCTITMDREKNVQAAFANDTYSLTVSKAGTGSGVVNSAPDGIACGPACNANYAPGTVVTLTATPDPGSRFTGWSGACEGTGTCTLVLDNNRSAVAGFARLSYPLTVERRGDGTGTVASTPAGIECGAACAKDFDAGTRITLTATPATGTTFGGWEGGGCTGTGTCSLTLNEATTVVATFVRTTFNVSISRSSGGAVTSAPAGINCGAQCEAPFPAGTRIVLTATPALGATFGGWGGAGLSCGENPMCELIVDGPKAVSARFTYVLTVRRAGSGPGTIRSAPTGIDCGSTCTARFDSGAVVTLTAEPTTASTFLGWSGDCSGSDTACTLTMSAARSATATFTRSTYSLIVQKAGNGTGTVTSNPAGITCGPACSANFDAGSTVSLTAVPDSGMQFAGWSGACTGMTTCEVAMNSVQVATATFNQSTYPLRVERTGSGTVTSDPFGVFCGPLCTASFTQGTMVTLTASPDSGATFGGWGGACTGAGATCVVTMNAAKTVNATFGSNAFALTVSLAGQGSGVVTSTPAGIDCGASCGAQFSASAVVTLAAAADSGSTFLGWSGACSGLGDCVVSMTGPRTVTATFSRTAFRLEVTRAGSGTGTVESTPEGIDCGAPTGSTCAANFEGGTTVSLVATPNENSTFDGWTGECTGTSTCTLAMTAVRAVTANFKKIAYRLRVANVGGGDVTSTPFGLFCGPLCETEFDAGATVTLSASPDPTGAFAGWSGACTGTGPCTLTMDSPKDVTARFTFRLSVVRAGNGAGSVSANVGNISCGSTCQADYDANTEVTLNAAPGSTSVFSGWSGACSGTGACVVSMDLAKSVTATFTNNVVALNVSRTGTGSGSVNSSPVGIDCGASCSVGFLFGTQVTLSATPAPGSTFSGWGGACTGAAACVLALDGPKAVSATFTRVLNRLTVVNTGGGTVTSEPGGIYCGASCIADFEGGALVTLTATPDVGGTFAGWTGACSGLGDCVVTMNAASTATARFRFPVLVSRGGTGQGTIISTPEGINCGGAGTACAASFDNAASVRLVATPAVGSRFDGWTGACAGLTDCVLAMDGAKEVTATFERSVNTLSVNLTGNGGGTVVSTPTGINCGDTCSAVYDVGTTINLTATPNADSTFAGWSGACTGNGTCSFTMESARLVSATFTLRSYALSVTRTGRGTVTSDIGGIFCGAACTATLTAGSVVVLTATPESGAQFAGWAGACAESGATPTCTVNVTGAKTASATFTTNTFGLTVSPAGTGSGTVSSAPSGIDCGATCTAAFDSGTVVVLSATPSATSSFTAWGGACSGTGVCSVTMSAARSVTATFTRNTFAVTVSKVGTGTGTVASITPVGIDCGSTCAATFNSGATITLRATADATSTFAGWSGACANMGDCTFTLGAAANVTATFTRRTHALTIVRSGPGTVTSLPSRIYCGAACVDSFDAGSVVTLTATPDANATFSGWTGGCVGTGLTCDVTMNAAQTVTATFLATSHILTVTKPGTGTGTVTSTPAGVNCGSACTVGFNAGTVLTLTATPTSDSVFGGWGGACSGSGACVVTMSQAQSVSATFTRNTFLLSIQKSGTGAGTVTSNTGGINCGGTCSATYNSGTSVTLTAAPTGGATFAGWSGGCVSASTTCTVAMDQAKTVTASFSGSTFSLAVSAGAGGGVVTSDVGGIYCGAACAATYTSGALVTLTAIPEPTALFAGWSGACAAAGTATTCQVTIDGAKTAGARFTYRLTLLKTGAGTGAVTSSPAAINCGGGGSLSTGLVSMWGFDEGSGGVAGDQRSTNHLTIQGATWTTSGCRRGAACLSFNGTSNFLQAATPTGLPLGSAPRTMSIWINSQKNLATDTETGIIQYGTPTDRQMFGLITSLNSPNRAYFYGHAADIGGTQALGQNVWHHIAVSYDGAVARLYVNGQLEGSTTRTLATTLQANGLTIGWRPLPSSYWRGLLDEARLYDRALSAGEVLALANESQGTSGCSADFDNLSGVTLTAAPDADSTFVGWSGACSGAGACSVLMDSAKTVTANFARATYAVSVTKLGGGTGTVTSSVGSIACGATCSATYDVGTSVTLTAAADANAQFAGWSGDCTGNGTCLLAVNGPRNVTATFTRRTVTLTVNRTGRGLVTSNVGGLFCGAACTATLEAGTSVTLTPSPESSATFSGWTGTACTGTGACTFTITADTTVGAPFVTQTNTLTVTKVGTGGTVSSSPAGIDCGSTCSASFATDALVTLTATPDSSTVFSGWSGACSGTGLCIVTMTAARAVTATFGSNTFPLTVSRLGSGTGTVAADSGSLNCGSVCQASYNVGTVVNLVATADSNSTFAGWSGACSNAGTCQVTMNAANTVFATFTKRTFALTVTRSGGGTVTSQPAGLYCGAACSGAFDASSTVTLTATPDATATFATWGGACTGATPTCTVTMDAVKNVTATFNVGLSVVVSGTGVGTVTSAPTGISCGTTCSATFPGNTPVTLTATADGTSAFAGWSGACTGTATTCLVTLDAAKQVAASFTQTTYPLTVSRTGSGSGTITSAPAGIDCGLACTASYVANTPVTLTATPTDSSSTFLGWSGAGCMGTSTCVVTMSGARQVTATFNRVTYTLTVTRTSGGTITSDPSGVYCGAACSLAVPSGTSVTLSALTDVGASFAGWTGACMGSAACVVTMDQAKTVNARFTYPVTVSRAGTGQGTVTSDTGGINCGGTCAGAFNGGANVTLTATPAPNTSFAGWTGACAGTQTTCLIAVDGAKNVGATFNTNTATLAVARLGNGGGTISSSPGGIDCGALCQANFDMGSNVTLTAVPDATSTFAGWTGACTSTDLTCVVPMTGSRQATATFTRRTFNLTLTRFGAGTVTSDPAGVYCGVACASSFPAGTQVVLSAVADPGNNFVGWSGAGCSGTGTCTVTLNANTSVTANFTNLLTINKSGSGTVTSNTGGINCGTACTGLYAPGTVVTLTATPFTNQNFAGWSGACVGTESTCQVTMDGTKTVGAAFSGVGPGARTTVLTNAPTNPSRSTTAIFWFASTPQASEFNCRIDGGAATPCSSPTTYTGLAEGTHTFSVQAVAPDGGSALAPANYAWTIDTVSPQTSITGTPPARTNVRAPTFTFTSTEPGSSFTCKVGSGAFVSCTSPYTTPTLSDGTHTFFVIATDVAGNSDPFPAQYTWVLDTVAPNTTITVNPTNPSNVTSPQFQFTSDEPGTFRCKLDSGTAAPCTSPMTVTISGEGTHTFEVTAIDVAGTADPTPAVYTWTLDTIAPITTLGTPRPPSLTNVPTATFSFSSNEPGTFRCSLNNATFTTCASPISYSNLTHGAQNFRVFAVDNATNQDATPESYSWNLDTIPPTASLTSTPAARTNTTVPVFSFTSNESGSTFQCRFDGGSFAACVSPFTGPTLAEGSHTFEVRAIDPATNVQPSPTAYTWVIDLTAPNTTITSAPPNPSNNTNPSFSFTSTESGSTFRCSLDGAAPTPCTSPQSVTVAHGSHTFTVAAVDVGGNADDTPALYTWTVDTVAPNTTLDPPTTPTLTNASTATFTFSSNEAGTFMCQLNSDSPTVCTSPQTYSGTAITNRTNTFSVYAIDLAGNPDTTPSSYTWSVDSIPPPVPGAPIAVGADRRVTLTWTAVTDTSPGGIAGYRVYRDGSLIATLTPATTTTYVDTATVLVNYDPFAYRLTSFDVLGNESAPSQATFGVPYTPLSLPPLSRIATGSAFSCGLKGDSTRTWCWGTGGNGQLGNQFTGNQPYLNQPVNDLTGTANTILGGLTSVSAGQSHACGVRTGNAFCWGLNSNAQIGNNSTTQANYPFQVVGPTTGTFLTDVLQVSAGGTHTCALKTDGTVWCWGNNTNRQLAVGSLSPLEGKPLQVLGPTSGFLTGITHIATGISHTCATTSTGTVFCWGLNNNGQLGDNTTSQRERPVQVLDLTGAAGSQLTNVLSITASPFSNHTCAARLDGTAVCWGIGNNGQLGFGSTGQRNIPTQVVGVGGTSVLTRVVRMAAGQNFTCAQRISGDVVCWGVNSSGQLGDNTTSQRNAPVTTLSATGTQPFAGALSMSAGGTHVCTMVTDGSIQCWGANSSGQLGLNRLVAQRLPVRAKQTGPITGVRSVSAGGRSFTHAVKDDGTIFGWGTNGNAQLGDGTSTQQTVASQVADTGAVGNFTTVTQANSGEAHACALKANGTVWCWGSNSNGRLGENSPSGTRNAPVQVAGIGGAGFLAGAVSVRVGASHSCAIIGAATPAQQTLVCWGANANGQLGDDSPLDRVAPVQVVAAPGPFLTGVTSIGLGQRHSCAVLADTTVRCWGFNGTGQLGDNSTTQRLAPVQVLGTGGTGTLTNVTQVAACVGGDSRGSHTCAVKADGTAWCWGSGSLGQLGDNTGAQRNAPVQVVGVGGSGFLTSVSSISCGAHSTCATKSDGTVYCWGMKRHGGIGDNTTSQRNAPVQVVGVGGSGVLTGITQTWGSRGGHFCGRKSDGTVWCWGRGSEGALGDGQQQNRTAPVQALEPVFFAYQFGAAVTHTTPASPTVSTTPLVIGGAQAGSTVQLYGNATCTGALLGSGTATADGTFSIGVTVPAGTTTTFYARATDATLGVSPCSATGFPYEARLPARLTVTTSGTTGTVTSSPAGIDCGATCFADFPTGIRVTLTATGSSGNQFASWSGACAGASPTCTVTMDEAKSVNAAFVRFTFMSSCTGDVDCNTGEVCYQYRSTGQRRCTLPCTQDSQCPAPSSGCQRGGHGQPTRVCRRG